jgi:hypothetical protein
LSKKPFQKELAMHRLTFDPGQRRVLLLVLLYIIFKLLISESQTPSKTGKGTPLLLLSFMNILTFFVPLF